MCHSTSQLIETNTAGRCFFSRVEFTTVPSSWMISTDNKKHICKTLQTACEIACHYDFIICIICVQHDISLITPTCDVQPLLLISMHQNRCIHTCHVDYSGNILLFLYTDARLKLFLMYSTKLSHYLYDPKLPQIPLNITMQFSIMYLLAIKPAKASTGNKYINL